MWAARVAWFLQWYVIGLLHAEAILLANQSESDNFALLAETCNNLGCCCKNDDKCYVVLRYLGRAMEMNDGLNSGEVL